MFDTFLGLPLHPLVVHAPVVLFPLATLGVIALVARPAWRERFAALVLGLLAAAVASAFAAILSGEALAHRVGDPGQHEALGKALAFWSLGYLVVAGLWLWWVRRPQGGPPAAREPLGWVAALASVAILVLTVLTGHSGATAAWGDALAPTPTTPAAPTQTAGPGTPAATSSGYTMADVAAHNSSDRCWAAVDGQVYDLTDWIAQHPGGPNRIVALCGTDATAAFHGQHGTSETPAKALARFLLGPLS